VIAAHVPHQVAISAAQALAARDMLAGAK